MINFVQVTDIHLMPQRSDLLHNIPIFDLFCAIIESIKKKEHLLDFVVFSGDLADKGCFKSYYLFNSVVSTLNLPCYWVAGNHDNLGVLQKISTQWQLLNEKSFTVRDYHFILLNSVFADDESKNKSRGKLEKTELLFLENELSKHLDYHCVIVLHHPPIFSGTWKDERMLKNYDDFFDVVDRYKNVKLVLYGHQHQAYKTVRNNVIYFSPPAASFQFDRNIKWGFENSFSGYGLIKIDKNALIACNDVFINFQINPIYAK
ncbi:MAG: metallophosphoesterase [Algoriphagus sp.]|uniref:metallophosphoesterase n=2 Tax=Algoriphagus sp. TaxID=1872435 RepID=UPI003297D868